MKLVSLKQLSVVLLVLASQVILAQQEKAYSIKDAVDYALQNNINVKNAKLEYLSTKKKITKLICQCLSICRFHCLVALTIQMHFTSIIHYLSQ